MIRLAALLPGAGCRRIADTFDALHRDTRSMTVGKSYVAVQLRRHQEEIVRRRRQLKHRRPRPLPRNRIWGLDLTYVDGVRGPRTVLGLIDHGSRACLLLRETRRKTAVVVLRHLLDAIQRYGSPQAIRTDNEPFFTSRLFRLGLLLLGIRHQRTRRCVPWQNGRIERLFGTFKAAWRAWTAKAGVPAQLQPELDLFRAWYNHVRPHQHLDGRTPAEAWDGKSRKGGRRARYACEWDGALTGFYLPP
ncbi:MAG: integrase core domain-containing protein [Holophagales bacterium]|nr:integrase core domain-containing protein [Holophagales bacterium]